MRLRVVACALAAAASLPSAAEAIGGAGPPSVDPAGAATAAPPPGDAEARRKLEAEIARELGQGGSAAAGGPPAAGSAPAASQGTAAQGQTGGNPMARLLLLPDISAIGSFSAAYDTYDVARLSPRTGPYGPAYKPTPALDEVELGLQSVIDPYARADIFISFAPDGVTVEEAYLTTLNLPAGLQIRAGQLFSPFGRQNQQHPHVWDFVDAPLARDRIVAADVLSGPGLDLAWLAPLPWFLELHLAGQGTDPYPSGSQRLTGIARLLQYVDVAEGTTLGVGISAGRRDEVSGGGFRDLGAVDLFLKWRPVATRGYLALQAEAFARAFRNIAGAPPTATGWYAQLFWRRDAYFGYGVRYDQAPSGPDYGAPANAAAGTERRYSAVASWFPSEFQRLRLQATWDERPGGQSGWEWLLALELGIGAHGAHPF